MRELLPGPRDDLAAMRWCSLATALPLFAYAVYANEEAEPPEEPFVLPPLQPIASHSWRGPLDEGGRIPGFEISGNAYAISFYIVHGSP